MESKGKITADQVQEAMKLAQSDAGRQLYALLQRTQGQQFQAAMEQASSGNYDAVKKALDSMLSDPQARELLKKMRK
jgi:ubiquinone biosynthesis protein Coq4